MKVIRSIGSTPTSQDDKPVTTIKIYKAYMNNQNLISN